MGHMNLQDIAKKVLEVLGTGRQLEPFSKVYPDFGLKDAYSVTAAVRAEREARGERPIGRKIGFTNRTIWAEYGVYAPIWGYVYDRTVSGLTSDPLEVSLSGLAEPRIEPEIMFGLAAPPEPGMDEHALIRCIDWLAHGFEIVQSIFPNWSFQAADTVAGYGLHGRLFVGPRHSAASRRNEWASELSRFEIDLFRNGAHVDHGAAANVLDGPLFALRHLAETLAQDPESPPLAAGEIVTTGTLTRAFPVAAGEEWSTKVTGIPLEDARIRFV
jgi:2-oxo-3-hexenedioate decarboxylase